MGVYVFRCIHAPYTKVGHHLATRARPNAYYRVATSGFQACLHPAELDGKVYMRDLQLVAWYPRMTRADETALHRQLRTRRSVGEFHACAAEDAVAACEALGGVAHAVGEEARLRAARWGWRQVRKWKRRAGKK